MIFAIVSQMSSCRTNENSNEATLGFDEVIDLANFKKVHLGKDILTIGTPRYYVIKDEYSFIVIKNLPLKVGYSIKINGAKKGVFTENGNWVYSKKERVTGHKKSLIQIFDKNDDLKLEEWVTYQVSSSLPFVVSEFGKYLIEGVSNEIYISNLQETCPSVRLKLENGYAKDSGRGYYNLTPNQGIEKLALTVLYNGKSYVKEFEVVALPPPKIEFFKEDELRCIDLSPSGVYQKFEYITQKITAYSLKNNTEITIENTNCYKDSLQLIIKEII